MMTTNAFRNVALSALLLLVFTPLALGCTLPNAQAQKAGRDEVKGRLENGKPVGLFFMTRYWSYTSTLEKAAWYFAPDGTVYQNLAHGFSEKDLNEHEGPKGKYSVEGNQMVVQWEDGKETRSEIEPDKSAFTWDMGIFTPANPIESKEQIAGVYEGGESLAVGGDRAMVSKSLELRADGSFHWSGVSFLSTETERSRLSGGATSGTSGTWTFESYSITLSDDNGTTYRAIAFPFDDGRSEEEPGSLFLGGTMYKKQQ